MLARCYNERNSNWKHYGKRGIEVCQRWRDSFWNFYADMGPKPGPKHSLEREDVNGDYEPGNCRWATQREQMRNTTRANKVVLNGRVVQVHDLAEELGISRETLRSRLERGWDIERVIRRGKESPPGRASEKTVEAFGRTRLIAEWAAEYGLPQNLLHCRLNQGWLPEEAVSTPKGVQGRHPTKTLTAFGQTKTVKEWSEEYEIDYNALNGRLRAGWKPEKALKTPVRPKKSTKKV